MSQFTSHVHVSLSLALLAIALCTIDGSPSTASYNPEAKARKQNNDNSATASPTTHGGRPSLTTYDQRQNGKYNIHVNIKDVKIIAVDGENLEGNLGDDTVYDYGDYDYDPAHLTISPLPIFGSGSVSITKPPKSTTKAPFTTTTTTTTTKQPNAQSSSTGSGSSSTMDSTTSTTEPATTTLTLAVPVKNDMAKPHLKTNDSSSSVQHDQPAATDQSVTATSTASDPPSSNIIVIKPTPSPIHYDYQEIPVQVIVDPIVRPKYRSTSNHQVVFPHSVAFHRQHDRYPIRRSSIQCHEGEYRDREGNCRARRSGILKLFRLLSSLNEKND
ncbi:nuclear pore complex protein DDB_G0274915 [Anopheles bellator]|uniref:nuclear pore complex protein DDB_G0274915 n=1 Tax=Anopheles bellator TaxID=139047 RepID=UPI00264A3301|nr:nuclear pore complex protein DDB_G0274915 [Anopheles bellator]